jgi:hypothetical protein
MAPIGRPVDAPTGSIRSAFWLFIAACARPHVSLTNAGRFDKAEQRLLFANL